MHLIERNRLQLSGASVFHRGPGSRTYCQIEFGSILRRLAATVCLANEALREYLSCGCFTLVLKVQILQGSVAARNVTLLSILYNDLQFPRPVYEPVPWAHPTDSMRTLASLSGTHSSEDRSSSASAQSRALLSRLEMKRNGIVDYKAARFKFARVTYTAQLAKCKKTGDSHQRPFDTSPRFFSGRQRCHGSRRANPTDHRRLVPSTTFRGVARRVSDK